jgi:TnpA family transposase
MSREWTEADFDAWLLVSDKRVLLGNKSGASRLGFAVLLKFFQTQGRFPRMAQEISQPAIEFVAEQVGVPATEWGAYDWQGRSIKYHRAEIRTHFGFREATVDDGEALVAWLCDHVLPKDCHEEHVEARLLTRCRELRIEPPSEDRIERLVRSAITSHEEKLCAMISARLDEATRRRLDELLELDRRDNVRTLDPEATVLNALRADAGKAGVKSIETEVAKLACLRALGLPADLFAGIAPMMVRAYRQRAAVEEPYELRRHPEPVRMALLAAFTCLRAQEIVDTLVDLLVQTVHRIGAHAEKKVEQELFADLRRVAGKHQLLFQVADAALAKPDGIVKDVVYPVVDEETLKALVKEWRASGPAYRNKVQTIIRSSYSAHYRRMVPALLGALEFRSNNETHRPVIRALALVRKHITSKIQSYPPDEEVPIEDVVQPGWRDAVIDEGPDGNPRVNRLTYEICVLTALREKLRCKEIWVVGAHRFCNPEEDLPADFDAQRDAHYAALELPKDAQPFLDGMRRELADALRALDRELPENPDVEILHKAGGWIRLSPLAAQPEPQNLVALKLDMAQRWPMTSLLDILKETDLRVGLTDVFRSATPREHLDREALRPRLLLALYGLGTNTGIKRMSAGQPGISYRDLLYARWRFVTNDHLREAIRRLVNATFKIRLPHIWGEGTTACASDSKQFGSWDQNLMTEWHVRYGGRGVMIYWHVERKSACIHSQLKTCSSSEVAAMIEGALHHNTDAEIEKNYVDSHGQSDVAFAFCRLLGFELLPRFKGIHKKRLYRHEPGSLDEYPNLQPVLSRPIDWELIAQQYDQMVKYTTALRLGTANAESILRRFTRANVQHPTYKALLELGKAQRTIFLCSYLRRPELRREIHEGLNVVENWNSANGFIHYGNAGEFATNNREEQEAEMLCLHLLQMCLVYVNTLMIQTVLADPAWMARMTGDDFRGLTPLVYGHVTPYGSFHLDMSRRLQLDAPEGISDSGKAW